MKDTLDVIITEKITPVISEIIKNNDSSIDPIYHT